MAAIISSGFSFNTQPPEGGWRWPRPVHNHHLGFNTQPPEGGWDAIGDGEQPNEAVSTHSRLKAAGTWGTADAEA